MTDELRTKIKNILKRGGVEHKKAAINYLLKIGDADAIEFLREFAKDSNAEIKYLARKAIDLLEKRSKVRVPDALDPDKLRAMLSAYDYRERLQAVQYIRDKKLVELVPELEELIKNERHEFVLSAVVKALGELAGRRVCEKLVAFLDHSDERVRANAVEALEIAGCTEAVPHIMVKISDPEHRVRVAAIKAILTLAKASLISEISEMIKSPQVSNRDSVAYLLGEIVDKVDKRHIPRIKEFVVELLYDPVSDIRKKALEVAKKYFANELAEHIEYIEKVQERERVVHEILNEFLGAKMEDIAQRALKEGLILDKISSPEVKDRSKVIADILALQDDDLKLYLLATMLSDPEPDVVVLVVSAMKYDRGRLRDFIDAVESQVDLGIPESMLFTMQLEERLRAEADRIWQEQFEAKKSEEM